MRATVWAAANQLGVAAGTPAELLTAVLAGPRRAARVELAGNDPETGALARDLRALGRLEVTLHPPPPPGPAPEPDLSDPVAVCAADPVRVTRAYEASPGGHRGLRTAWLRAGQALIRPGQTPAGRALALWAALGEGGAQELRPALEELARDTPWEVAGVREAPVSALTTCGGRLVLAEDPRVRALACMPPGGAELRLDERGRLRVEGPAPRLVRAVAATLATHPASALAAAADAVVTGDRMGSVHAFSLGGLRQAAPHSGRVTALAATGAPGLRVYSGGADGAVHLWEPPREPRLVARRPHPVVTLHAGGGGLAVAWADGLVELHEQAGDRETAVRRFRPGPAVRAVALRGDGGLAVAAGDVLVTLRVR
ncbi:hypothetical protein I3F58_18705 [Streptomyces sp. MUM 203J]|uniref:hypothetical protein n=1 Tax=Streptomyces sp. MUM 203J TaxID=2791990 RepID=UPI001F04A791|nr:hypothetical protein [Streptomyces sp. MUM 203J]MCH0541554.1 hypothetical protein [Streptomyces sp. MUM 203J]